MNKSDLSDLEGLGIPGLSFRPFAGEADLPAMVGLTSALAGHEGVAPMCDIDTVRLNDQWLSDFDPPRDRVIIELNGELIGSARVAASPEPDESRIYGHTCNLLPQWRGRGIELPIFRHNENRLREMAKKYPRDKGRFFRVQSVPETNPEAMRVLDALGYQPIRYGFHMVRPNLDNIPQAALPEGVEVRPVVEGEERALWDANLEAFRDHWGYQDPPPNGFETWRKNPLWDRSLSRVAWAKNEVAGMVLIHAPREHDAGSGRKVAETEQICVCRPWRRKGIATALIALCLHALKGAGFHEAALGVDAQNLSGALRIYERMGYEVARRYTTFQRPMG